MKMIKYLITSIEDNQYSEWSSSYLPTILLQAVNNSGHYCQRCMFLRLLESYRVNVFVIKCIIYDEK